MFFHITFFHSVRHCSYILCTLIIPYPHTCRWLRWQHPSKLTFYSYVALPLNWNRRPVWGQLYSWPRLRVIQWTTTAASMDDFVIMKTHYLIINDDNIEQLVMSIPVYYDPILLSFPEKSHGLFLKPQQHYSHHYARQYIARSYIHFRTIHFTPSLLLHSQNLPSQNRVLWKNLTLLLEGVFHIYYYLTSFGIIIFYPPTPLQEHSLATRLTWSAWFSSSLTANLYQSINPLYTNVPIHSHSVSFNTKSFIFFQPDGCIGAVLKLQPSPQPVYSSIFLLTSSAFHTTRAPLSDTPNSMQSPKHLLGSSPKYPFWHQYERPSRRHPITDTATSQTSATKRNPFSANANRTHRKLLPSTASRHFMPTATKCWSQLFMLRLFASIMTPLDRCPPGEAPLIRQNRTNVLLTSRHPYNASYRMSSWRPAVISIQPAAFYFTAKQLVYTYLISRHEDVPTSKPRDKPAPKVRK